MKEIIYKCGKCGQVLGTDQMDDKRFINIYMLPCDRCMLEKYNEGYSEGKEHAQNEE